MFKMIQLLYVILLSLLVLVNTSDLYEMDIGIPEIPKAWAELSSDDNFLFSGRRILKRKPKSLGSAQDSSTFSSDPRGNDATRASALIYDIDHLEYVDIRKPSGELVCMFKFDLKWSCETDSDCRINCACD